MLQDRDQSEGAEADGTRSGGQAVAAVRQVEGIGSGGDRKGTHQDHPGADGMAAVEGNQLRGQTPTQREDAEQRATRELDDDLVARLEPQITPAANRRVVVDEAERSAQCECNHHKATGD